MQPVSKCRLLIYGGNMNKLYRKSEIGFAVSWIIVYVVGASIADSVSETIGISKLITFVFLLLLSGIMIIWLGKNGLYTEYGLCRTGIPARLFLYYIPLLIPVSCNLWHGVTWNYPPLESALYFGSMLLVGFLEELIFRGLLFRAMSRDNVKSAVIVSSITFGIGHIVNLFNGSGAELIPNLCQVISAIFFGFLFVILFHRGKSLLPCILTHSLLNGFSTFADEANRKMSGQILDSVILIIFAAGYTIILLKTLPDADETQEETA